MGFNFDTVRELRGRHRSIYDHLARDCGVASADGIAMWKADMHFDVAPCITEALRADIESGGLGYWGDSAPVDAAVCGWMHDRHGWTADPGWIRYTNGVVAGLAMVMEAFSDPGDALILFTPVYHSFFGVARAMNREILQSHLVERDGRYEMDLDTLQGQLTGRERIVVLCSPHNPGGRLWTSDEISALADFCIANDLILCSDEIHMDLCFPGARHRTTAVAAPQIISRLVTITAASKGFNTAGGETGFAIVPDDELRARFDVAFRARGGTPNRFGMIMTLAAFTGGSAWSEAVRAYIAENFRVWRDRLGAIPGIGVMDMQATYLTWVDFSDTGMSGSESLARIRNAGIGVTPGAVFGDGGDGRHRFNIALPRALMLEAANRIEAAFADLR